MAIKAISLSLEYSYFKETRINVLVAAGYK